MPKSLLDRRYGTGIVVFNWKQSPIDDLDMFGDAYHAAGKLLVEKFENTPGFAYELIPIFFLYRHAVELYLKAIAYQGAKLLNLTSDDRIANDPKLLSSHGLKRYVPLLRKICSNRGWRMDDKDKGHASLDEIFHFIEELDGIDPKSYAFRYPVSQLGQGMHPHHTTLDAIHFGKTLDPVLDLLGGMLTGIEHGYDTTAEMLFEVQELLRSSD